MSRAAVFLDRDGVLVEDAGPATAYEQLRILKGVPESLARLKSADYVLAVVTNQTVVSRGLLTIEQVKSIHRKLSSELARSGAEIDGFYICPHHPNATVPAYRTECECRKPGPGLLFAAADDLNIDLDRSYLIGDRISDIVAGVRAGVTTIQVRTGRHDSPPIESDEWPEPLPEPDFVCADVVEAADIILNRQS